MRNISPITQIAVAGAFLMVSRASGQSAPQSTTPSTPTTQPGAGDLYFDMLTSSFYREKPDGTMQRLGRRPGMRASGPVSFHVLNVNAYGKQVVVKTQNVTLFEESPGFSPAGWLGAISGPSDMSRLKALGVTVKGAGGSNVDAVGDVQSQINDFNSQREAVNEISNLDAVLRCMAARDTETLTPDPVDPRRPGMAASEKTRAKIRAYMQHLFSDTTTQTGVQLKGTETVLSGGVPTQTQLLQLADGRISKIRETFTKLRRGYMKVRQNADAAIGNPAAPDNTGLPGGSVQVVTKDTTDTDLQTQEDQLDQAYEQAEYDMSTIQGSEASREASLQNAASTYSKVMSQNIYQYDTGQTIDFSNGDLIQCDIQIYDANAPAAPSIAESYLEGETSAAASNPSQTSSANPEPSSSGAVTLKATTTQTQSNPNRNTQSQGPSGPSGPGQKPGGGGATQSMQPGQVMGQAQGQQSNKGAAGGQNQGPEQDIKSSIYVTGRLKVDFSTGFMFSNVVNNNYGYRLGAAKSGPPSDYGIVVASHDSVTPSIGGLAHVYITSTSMIVPALSFGAGQASNGTLQYFLGPSLLIGHDQRFVLTAGFAGGAVARVSGGEFLGQDVGSTKPSSPVTTSNVFRTGYFIGLTYNLTH